MSLRESLESGFERFGYALVRHRWLAIALPLLLAFGLGSQLPKLQLDAAPDTFLHPDDPMRISWGELRDQYGRDELILVLVRTPEVFDLEFLERLREFHRALDAQVPHVEEITSLVNVRNTRGEADVLIVEDLLESWPQGPADLERLRARVMSNPFYRGLFISPDGRATTVVIRTSAYTSQGSHDPLTEGFEDDVAGGAASAYISADENREAVEATLRVLDEYRSADFQLSAAGTPVMTALMTKGMQTDMRRFLVAMLAIICAILFVLFRRISAVVLPVVVVLLSILSTLGVMAAIGIAMNLPTQILPSFLLAVGVGAAVHILTITYQGIDRGESREDAIAHALGHSGLAVLMTGLTTAGGLASFSVAELAPIASLGLMAPIGILIGLVYCLVLMPALLSLIPLRRRLRGPTRSGGRIERLMVGSATLSVTHPRSAVAIIALLSVIGLAGALRLDFSHDFLGWFQEDHMIRTSTALMDEVLGGSMSLEVVVDTEKQNGIQDPRLLEILDRLQLASPQLAQDAIRIDKASSVVDVLKEIHQALNENRSAYYAVPKERELVAQELLLFENSGADDLELLVDSGFSQARLSLRVPYVDPLNYVPFIAKVENTYRTALGDSAQVTVTGIMAMMSQTIGAVMVSMARSYVLAMLIITPLMILLIGKLGAGLASMIPNVAPILITLGLMGWTGMPIDVFTLMIGGIAIGLAVDDTIHFMHNFRRYYERSGDAVQATRETLQTTGHALLATSIVLASGFAVYTLSELNNLYYFGLLVSFCIVTAFIVDILVSPALMVLTLGREKRLARLD